MILLSLHGTNLKLETSILLKPALHDNREMSPVFSRDNDDE